MSFKADDEEISVFRYAEEEEVRVEDSDGWNELREEAVSAQRLGVRRLARKYVKGRMEITYVESKRKLTPEKIFNLPRMIVWNEGDPDEVIEMLAAGRVRARLSAAMGVGKSVKLATQCAERLGQRVLHVALDALALRQVAMHVARIGTGRYRKHWTTKREARVCAMTYADFNGTVTSTRRNEFFSCFDTIIFDEGFEARADVFVAKRFFSVYAPADTNLLVCSATISVDPTAVAESAGMGSFRQMSGTVSLEEAVETGKLVGQYLVDRTVALVPNDAEVDKLEAHYLEYGVDVRVLHSAASEEDLDAVCNWLSDDATTSRVVVAHVSFCIAFNMPVEYVILSPFREVVTLVGDRIETHLEPLSEEMVAQAKARTGRKIVAGSGGIILSEARGPTLELEESEKFEAFAKLSAGCVTPMRTPFWAACYEMFPDGLDATVAITILKINLPVQVAVRFLCKDGRVASRFDRALNFFSQPDHFHLASDQEYPDSYATWPLDELQFGVVESIPVKVPCLAVGELQVILHAIVAMADGHFSLERWRPKLVMTYGNGFESDGEDRSSQMVNRVPRLRRVTDVEKACSVPVLAPELPWSYRSQVSSGSSRRTGGVLDKDRLKEALLELERSLLEYKVPAVAPEAVVETDSGTVAEVTKALGAVESPGGSVVCTMPLPIYEKANLGCVLQADEFVQFVEAYRTDRDRFVQSRMFDAFSGPWECTMRSLLDESVISLVVRKGYAVDAYGLVNKLRARFSVELCSVLSQSYIFKRRFMKIFTVTPSTDALMHSIKSGRFNGVAQSDAFLERVKMIKELIDRTLIRAESHNVYLPTYITSAQRMMPVQGNAPLGLLGREYAPMSSGVSRALHYEPSNAGMLDRLDARMRRGSRSGSGVHRPNLSR